MLADVGYREQSSFFGKFQGQRRDTKRTVGGKAAQQRIRLGMTAVKRGEGNQEEKKKVFPAKVAMHFSRRKM